MKARPLVLTPFWKGDLPGANDASATHAIFRLILESAPDEQPQQYPSSYTLCCCGCGLSGASTILSVKLFKNRIETATSIMYPVCDQEAAQGQHRNISAGEGKSQTSCLPRQRILRGIKRRIAKLTCQQMNIKQKRSDQKNELKQCRYSCSPTIPEKMPPKIYIFSGGEDRLCKSCKLPLALFLFLYGVLVGPLATYSALSPPGVERLFFGVFLLLKICTKTSFSTLIHHVGLARWSFWMRSIGTQGPMASNFFPTVAASLRERVLDKTKDLCCPWALDW